MISAEIPAPRAPQPAIRVRRGPPRPLAVGDEVRWRGHVLTVLKIADGDADAPVILAEKNGQMTLWSRRSVEDARAGSKKPAFLGG